MGLKNTFFIILMKKINGTLMTFSTILKTFFIKLMIFKLIFNINLLINSQYNIIPIRITKRPIQQPGKSPIISVG